MGNPTDKDYKELSKQDVRKNGRIFHLLKCLEECAELTKAITQHLTKGDPVGPILQEIGDVEQACLNLRTIYGNKQIDRLKAEKYEHRDDKLETRKVDTDAVIEGIKAINKGEVTK